MQNIVIDTSVFAKLFINEEGSDRVVIFFDSALTTDTRVIVPYLFYYNVLNVAVAKGIDSDLVYITLQDYQNTILQYQHLPPDIIKKAFGVANPGYRKYDFSFFYDASFRILAIEYNYDFIIVDEKYLLKVKQFGRIKLLSQL